MLYRLLRYTAAPIAKILFRVKIIGRKNMPKGKAVLAINHTDFSDPLFVSMTTHRRIYFIANKNQFEYPEKVRIILKGTNCIPAECGRIDSVKILNKCTDIVKKGSLFAIFPEGSVKKELKNTKGYTGVAELALHSSSPIIPIAIQNLEGAFPTKKFIPRHLPKVTIRIGRPIYFKKYYNQHKNKKIIRIVTNKVMKEIKKLYKEH